MTPADRPGSGAREVEVYDHAAAVSRAAADGIDAAAVAAVGRSGRFAIALAGGSTPRLLYARLAAEYGARAWWPLTEVFFGDERCVPPADPASNYGMAHAALLAHVPVPAPGVHRIAGEREPREAAAAYDGVLRAAFDADATAPTFDVALLGVGPDGHTASLFAGDPAVAERARWALAVEAPATMAPRQRVTLTLPVLNRAREVMVLCAGAEKRDVVGRILGGQAPALPAALVRGTARTRWLVDRAALP